MLPKTSDVNIWDYIEILYKRIWYIIIPFTVSVGVAIALCYFLPKSYRSSTMILVEQQKVPENYVKSSVSSSIEDRLGTIREQLLSRTLLQKVIDEFKLYRKEAIDKAPEEIIEMMRKQIEIKVEKGKKNIGAFSISYEGEDPYSVMQVTNKLTSLFIEENLKSREEFVMGTTSFLDNELEGIKAELQKQEASLQEFKKRYMGALPEQMTANLQTLTRLQADMQATTDALARAEERKSAFLAGKGTMVVRDNIIIADPENTRLTQMEREFADLKSRFTDKHPEVIQKKNEINELKRNIMAANAEREQHPSGRSSRPVLSPAEVALQNQFEEINLEIGRLKARQKALEMQTAEYQARVENTPAREQQMLAIQRDYENTKGHYQSLLDKKLNARISENLEKRQQGEQFRIMDPANLPIKPYKPDQKKIILFGLLGGLAAGIGLAYLREMVDTSFARPEELEEAFQLPVLAAIPNISIALKKERKAG